MFSREQRWILSACAIVILAGGGLLLIDHYVVRSDQTPVEVRRAEVIEDLALEAVRDAETLQTLAQTLQSFAPLFGEITRIDAVLRQTQADATLWLVEFGSRHRDAVLDRSLSVTGVDAPRLLLLVEPNRDPGWQSFVQSSATSAPTELPPAWHARLARMDRYRMAIDRGRVAFVSQLDGSALVQSIEARTSPEFHPGLLNSALRVDVQQALDIVSALPGAPRLQRFYRIDVDTALPAVDRAALDRMRARQEAIKQQVSSDVSAVRARMAEQQEARRQQQKESLERFRDSMQASRERARSGTTTSGTAGAATSTPEAGEGSE